MRPFAAAVPPLRVGADGLAVAPVPVTAVCEQLGAWNPMLIVCAERVRARRTCRVSAAAQFGGLRPPECLKNVQCLL